MPPIAPSGSTPPAPDTETGRLLWADAAKGVCIVLVVLHHLTTKHYDLLVPDGTLAEAWWQSFTDALRPVRMPLFFLISGIFSAAAARRPWKDVVRRKVVTPYYVYVVWLAVHAVLFSVLTALPMNRTRSWTELAGDLLLASTGLWYLYALAVYFLLAKALLPLDRRVTLTLAAAASAVASLFPIEAANRESLLQHFVFFLGGVLVPDVAARVVALSGRHMTLALGAGTAAVAVATSLAGLPLSASTLLVSLLGVPLAIRLVAAACTISWIATSAASLGRRTLPVYVLHVPLIAVGHHLVVQVPALQQLPEAPAGEVILAFYPALASALVTAACLGVHSTLRQAGLGLLFRLPGSPTLMRQHAATSGTITLGRREPAPSLR